MNCAAWYQSPMGKILLIADEKVLKFLCFENDIGHLVLEYQFMLNDVLQQAIEQLNEYFNGSRRDFSIPLAWRGTDFQQSAWKTLQTVPYGKTWSYAQQAKIMKKPRAVRAVGSANGRNPLPIVVPCHRIIGANGSLGGYSYGLEKKQWLLDHERANLSCD